MVIKISFICLILCLNHWLIDVWDQTVNLLNGDEAKERAKRSSEITESNFVLDLFSYLGI